MSAITDIPLELQYWDYETIAKVGNWSVSHVRNSLAPLPNFPKARRPDNARGRSMPRFKASEVIAFIEGEL